MPLICNLKVNIETMTAFWIFIALILLISLLMIWVPHFRQQKLLQAEESGVRRNTNLELFAERLSILEREFKNDQHDQFEFDALKKELEVSLLQDMKHRNDDSLVEAKTKKNLFWPSLMTICIIGISGYFYQDLGAYQALANAPALSNPHAGMSDEQLLVQRVQMLESEVKQQPSNSQAWYSLGHAYISSSQYDKAIAAFDKTIEIVGVHAELLGPKATALYYQEGEKLTEKVQAVIDQSLAIDPQDPSTLLLVGMDAYVNGNYPIAVASWQKILDSGRTDIDRTGLIDAIESANQKQGISTVATNAEATISVTVTLDPTLADKVTADDSIFVFARDSKGPVAFTKIKATRFPVTITLDDANALYEDAKLSSVKEVEIIALVSKNDSIKPQTGDLKGTVGAVVVAKDAKVNVVVTNIIQ